MAEPLAIGRYTSLWPVMPNDVGYLYDLLVAPSNSYAWRYRGQTPTLQDFSSTLYSNTLMSAVVRMGKEGRLVGYCSIYDANHRSGFAYITVCVDAREGVQPALAPDAALPLLALAFDEWPFRKIYFERPGFVPGWRALHRHATHEATFTDRIFRHGRYWDVDVLSMSRESVAELWDHFGNAGASSDV